jgi:hypothetical protein
MKKLIAYSSIAHMGFVTLGCFMVFIIINNTKNMADAYMSLEGAMVQMLTHALSSGAMFFGVGVLIDRYHSRLIKDYGGVANSMPVFAAFFMLFAMANVGLPGTSGFVGEFLVILAAFKANFWYAFLAAVTLILGAAYTLWLVKRVVFGNITVQREVIHARANGERILVLHGDEFDQVVQCSPWLAKLGSKLYEWLIQLNHVVNWGRRRLGFPYWSLASFLKHKVKNAVQYIGNYEAAVARAAKQRDVEGVVCGHIHRAEISRVDGLLYLNCGDWVESCTALVETAAGEIELVAWLDERRQPPLPLPLAA